MERTGSQQIYVHGQTIQLPKEPVLMLCISGLSWEHLTTAVASTKAPNLSQMISRGGLVTARTLLPGSSILNQVSIFTMSRPNDHGIVGSSYYDPSSLRPISLLSSRFLRCEPVTVKLASLGKQVAVIMSKDSFYPLLAAGLHPDIPSYGGGLEPRSPVGIAISPKRWSAPDTIRHHIERIFQRLTANGDSPLQRTLFPIRFAFELLHNGQLVDCAIAVTDDELFHLYGPSEKPITEFFSELDRLLGLLLEKPLRLGVVSDHGVSCHCGLSGPQLIDLEPELTRLFGSGFKVHLPTRLVGSSGSYAASHAAFIYLPSLQPPDLIIQWLLDRGDIDSVYDRRSCVTRLHLPNDRAPDLLVFAAHGHAILDGEAGLLPGNIPPYGHGGRYEENVPAIFNFRLEKALRQIAMDLTPDRYWLLVLSSS